MTRRPALPTGFDIPVDKLTKFLLNPDGGKPQRAAFFLGLGFDPRRPGELGQALHEHTAFANHTGFATNAFGYCVVYEGPLETPSGPARDIRSVWQVDDGDASGRARFITAYRYR